MPAEVGYVEQISASDMASGRVKMETRSQLGKDVRGERRKARDTDPQIIVAGPPPMRDVEMGAQRLYAVC